jgi:eukaryotic-like serine/threonine-protein kinase
VANPDEEDFRGTERFRVERRLGAGAFGVVYEAYDRDNARKVALKVLRPYGSDAVYRFKHEFRALADITHPNLVTLYELLSDADRWFFTMELIEGVNFLEYVRGLAGGDSGPRMVSPTARTEIRSPDQSTIVGGGSTGSTASTRELSPPELERLRSALVQAVSGIRALHETGKLHRDIKPMNVLVTRKGRVVLLDFGLVTELDPEESDGSLALAGTPAYMSPEQGTGVAVSEASDWYSLGVMLYEALTGRRPFVGSFAEILVQKQERVPRPPRDVAPAIPENLDRLCNDLLRRAPEERPTGSEIAKRLGDSPARSREDTGATAAHVVSPFVGRAAELDALKSAFSKSQEGRAVEVHVHGSSGIGKTALVRRFLDDLRWTGAALVLTGRCYEPESVPFKALDSLIDALSRYLKRIAPAQVDALLPRDVPALIRLFPVLRRVEAVATARSRIAEIPDSQELRRRGFLALRELLGRLADRKPLVMFIDDLHWGDVDSALLLSELLRPPDAPAILLILAYRSEESETSVLLRKLLNERDRPPEIREIRVRELPFHEAQELARALLADGNLSARAQADAIALESAGSPFFIDELARYVRVGADLQTPSASAQATVDGVVHARISRLPEDARRALQLVAVAGQPIDVAVLQEAASPEIGPDAVAVLRARRLIRGRHSLDREEIEPYHDRVRQTVLAHMTPGDIREVHLRLALAWEASRRVDPETLMLHFQEAGQIDKAAEYAAAAAARASSALAFDRAARLYAIAFELGAARDESSRRALRVALAEALRNAGRGTDAARSYLVASEGAPAAEALELQRRAGEQLLRSGHLEEGISVLAALSKRIGMKFAPTPRRALLSLLLRRMRVGLHGLAFREREAAQVSADELMFIDTCWALVSGFALVDIIRARDFHARHLILALRAGEPYRVALTLAAEAAFASTRGLKNPRIGRILATAGALAERVGRPHALGMVEYATAISSHMNGNWKNASVHFQRAEEIFRNSCTGVAWELDATHLSMLRAALYMGEVDRVSKRLPVLIREALERDDLFAATSLRARVGHVVWLAAGEPDRARDELHHAIEQWSHHAYHLQHYFFLLAEAEIALYSGDGRTAFRLVLERWTALKRSLVMMSKLFRIESLHLRARSSLATAAAAAPQDLRPLLHEAGASARRIESEGVRWGSALAQLLRAGIASVEKRPDGAIELLRSAEDALRSSDMALHATVARRRRGELVGGEEGRTLVAEADDWMKGAGIRDPGGMARMLAPGTWSE